MIGSVLFLLVIVAAGFGLRKILSHEGASVTDGSAVRRFFQYLLLFGLLVVVAIGLTGLLTRLFGGEEIVDLDSAQLARSLTFVLIGGPLYAAAALWSRRRLSVDATEVRSLGWAVYTTLSTLTGLVVTMAALYDVLEWVVGAEDFNPGQTANFIVWALVWAAHWIVDRRLTPARHTQVHLLVGSAIGLGTSFAGLVGLLGHSVELLIGSPEQVLAGRFTLWSWALTAAVGLPVWWLYWVRTTARAERTTLWLAYVLLLGVAGGLVGALTSIGFGVFQTLVWFLGDPPTEQASRHFMDMPEVIAVAVIGLALWWYHRSLLSEPRGERSEVRRVYEYLMAGIGLLAASIGIVTLLVALLEAVAGVEDVLVEASAVNTLLGALTVLAIGAPVWWVYWRTLEKADAPDERSSPTRRVYLLLLFGVGGVAAVIALITAVFILVEDVLEGTMGAETVRSTRFAIGVLFATATLAGYHWTVFQADRKAVPEGWKGPRHITLIGPEDDEIARAVARRTGGKARLWPRTDGRGRTWSVDEVMDALEGTDAEEVVVLSEDGHLRAIPVTRP